MHTIWIAYGSNQGDPIAQLLRARQTLASHLLETGASALYRTPPWGYTAQPDFINAVVRYRTELAPLILLDLLQHIEQQQGRERPFKNAPRTLDLDLLAYDDLQLDHPRLTLPHPGICERTFVLRPLADLDPELTLGGQTIRAHLACCGDINIEPVARPDWQTTNPGENHAP
ncbi:2-amino-4-hydroxy-6-hydroxymethyldihydropteridine diphosphokinase [Cardiobacterium hominis]|uniref:2-amino-4-hydroxy-6- hydroxymethyldihydropteridine diphosphokinase n=1 Tax=Cardiobacterium hominis TaxID=2718 RepID=UPI0028E7905D|nr:2-amino-4-hydroxy-6-hydroxymethyldihydropteridine diphosphokinase [Cardiobacterium hominis]